MLLVFDKHRGDVFNRLIPIAVLNVHLALFDYCRLELGKEDSYFRVHLESLVVFLSFF